MRRTFSLAGAGEGVYSPEEREEERKAREQREFNYVCADAISPSLGRLHSISFNIEECGIPSAEPLLLPIKIQKCEILPPPPQETGPLSTPPRPRPTPCAGPIHSRRHTHARSVSTSTPTPTSVALIHPSSHNQHRAHATPTLLSLRYRSSEDLHVHERSLDVWIPTH